MSIDDWLLCHFAFRGVLHRYNPILSRITIIILWETGDDFWMRVHWVDPVASCNRFLLSLAALRKGLPNLKGRSSYFCYYFLLWFIMWIFLCSRPLFTKDKTRILKCAGCSSRTRSCAGKSEIILFRR